MGKIQYPPPTAAQMHTVIKQCFVYGDVLEIEFAVSGYFSHDNPIAFDPDPPTGNFVAPPTLTISQYFAISEPHTVTFSYLDTTNGKKYKYEITIKERCP